MSAITNNFADADTGSGTVFDDADNFLRVASVPLDQYREAPRRRPPPSRPRKRPCAINTGERLPRDAAHGGKTMLHVYLNDGEGAANSQTWMASADLSDPTKNPGVYFSDPNFVHNLCVGAPLRGVLDRERAASRAATCTSAKPILPDKHRRVPHPAIP